jgi:hypothetical protein
MLDHKIVAFMPPQQLAPRKHTSCEHQPILPDSAFITPMFWDRLVNLKGTNASTTRFSGDLKHGESGFRGNNKVN